MHNPSNLICTALLTAIVGAQQAIALPEDRLQPLEINAENNSGDVDGTLIYTGSVIITQGSLKLEADKVIAQIDKQTIDCSGQPASFQMDTEEYGLITGRAESLYFDRRRGTLIMSRDAKLTKADGSFTQGDAIVYNVDSETWTVEGATRTLLPPVTQKNKGKGDADGDS